MPPFPFSPKCQKWKVKVLVAQSCWTLCDSMGCSPPDSSVHGILQARILEWVAIFSSRDLPKDWTCISGVFCTGSQVLYHSCHLGSPKVKVSVTQSWLILGEPMDDSPPGSSVHGIPLARILEWVAMPLSSGYSQPKDWTYVSCISCIGGRFFAVWATRKHVWDILYSVRPRVNTQGKC